MEPAIAEPPVAEPPMAPAPPEAPPTTITVEAWGAPPPPLGPTPPVGTLVLAPLLAVFPPEESDPPVSVRPVVEAPALPPEAVAAGLELAREPPAGVPPWTAPPPLPRMGFEPHPISASTRMPPRTAIMAALTRSLPPNSAWLTSR